MATENLDAAELRAAPRGGLINESVMQQIFDISVIPLPFTELIGNGGRAENPYHSWTRDILDQPDPSAANAAIVDGASASGLNDTKVGDRVGNHCQINRRVIRVSTRAREVNTIGFSDTFSYQIMRRQQDMRRQREAIYLEPQASQEDNGTTIPGKLGGFPSWLTTNTSRGTGGADGGFQTGTGLVSAPTAGNARAITETLIRDQAESVWNQGGDPTEMMSISRVIRRISEYLFTSSARIATLRRDANDMGPAQAIGSVNIFLTDFGVTMRMHANRLQKTYASGDGTPIQVANLFLFDPAYVGEGLLHGYRTEELGKEGAADNAQILCDGTLIVNTERAHALIADVNPASPVTQA